MKKKKKLKKDEFEVELVDKLDDEDLFCDCPVCQFQKFYQDHGRVPTSEEQKEIDKKLDEAGIDPEDPILNDDDKEELAELL